MGASPPTLWKFSPFFLFFVEHHQSKSSWWWWWSGPEPTGEWGGEEEQSQLPTLVGEQPSARPGPQVSLCIFLFLISLLIPIENVCSNPPPVFHCSVSFSCLGKPSGKKVMFLWTFSVSPLAPPPPRQDLRMLRGGLFSKSAYRRLATIGEEKARRMPFLGKLIHFRGNYNFWCESDHFLGVNSDFCVLFSSKNNFCEVR